MTFTCKNCGGPLTATAAAPTVVMPPLVVTIHEDNSLTQETPDPTGWCGPCVAELESAARGDGVTLMGPSEHDRTVHAVTHEGSQIVRYDRSGKWYMEAVGGRVRTQLSLAEAVQLATMQGSCVWLGKPGGRRFDAAVRAAGWPVVS